jgi:hypothetical protein
LDAAAMEARILAFSWDSVKPSVLSFKMLKVNSMIRETMLKNNITN